MSPVVQLGQVQRRPRRNGHIRQHNGRARGLGLAGRRGAVRSGERAGRRALRDLLGRGRGRDCWWGWAGEDARGPEGERDE